MRITLALSILLFIACNRTPGNTADALSLEDVNASWILQDQRSTTPAPQIDLYFNYPVSPAEVREKLTVSIGGSPVDYVMKTLGDNTDLRIVLNGVTPVDKDIQASLIIKEGLRSRTESRTSAAEIKMSASIPSPFNLTINNLASEHDGLTGTVFVRTSQPVTDNISSLIKIQPAVGFSINKTDNGFLIRSNEFSADKDYHVRIEKGLRGTLGGVLHEEYENDIAFGELEPTVQFTTAKKVFLSSKGNRAIDIRIVNIEKVKLVISKIYENNLLSAQQYGYYPQDNMDEESYSYERYDDNAVTIGDIVYEQEIDAATLPQLGNSRLLKFNFEDKLADFKGIYHIKVRSSKDYWVSDSRFVAVSDIGLIAKEGADKLFVFANSIKTAGPMVGVNIIAYGNNNQVLGMAATNGEGVAEITCTRKEFAGFKPAMIVAKTENDFNYLPFQNTRVNTSRFETGGKRGNSTGLDAFVYSGRDIYRPGEKIDFSVIIRDRQWNSPGEIPIVVKLLLPDGKEFQTFKKMLNAQGSAEGSIEIPASAITGTYNLEIYSSNEILLTTQSFSIEEFVPDRIKVAATLGQSSLQPGSKVTLSINAVNFFGPPAAGRNYEMEVQVRARNFSPKKYAGYDFSIHNSGLSLDKLVRQGKTDAEGNAAERYDVPEMFRNNGLLQANFYTTVFDETGRPVSRSASADIFSQDHFFGIATDGSWYYPLNQQAKFTLVALDKNEKLLAGVRARIKMIKHEYRTVMSRSGSYFRYESQEEDKVLFDGELLVNGESTAYSFVPRSPGNYELRVSVPGAAGYVSKKFYSYGAWGGENSSFEVNADGNIDIETDKSVYSPGENAKLLLKTPFNGRLLLTMESDKVISWQYVNVEKRNASIDLKISSGHLPNVFITATLIKPHGISDIPLTVAHGFQNLKVEDRARINQVKIVAAATSRSRTKQQVTIKAEPGSMVTLAAVDNGVLQVSDFKTPNPYNFFYAARALEVNAFDIYPFLFPELRSRLSSTGGDGMDMRKRTNPMPSSRVQIVSYWSGISKADGDGTARFNINIPEFSGQLRLMAVAWKANTFGSAEQEMTIADPLVLSSSLPRFLSPGDTIDVPVTFANTTSRPANIAARIRTTGPLKVLGSSQQSVEAKPNAEGRSVFRLVASSTIDTGRVYIEAATFGEKFSQETAIGVRPASPLQVMSGSGSVTAGNKTTINIEVGDFMPPSLRYSLVVSKNPLLDIGRQLKYLVQYPYGCTEQVISTAFPQIYYPELVQQVSGTTKNIVSANENVAEAIRKIKLRQLYNGGVTLWEDQGSEHWWSSIYAAHFLLEAKKAGFNVDKNVLNGLLNYINSRLRNKQTIVYYYNRDQNKKIAPKEVAYSLYVLSLASRPNVSAMNYYKASPQSLSLDGKYLLSVAYAISGDKKRSREILPSSFSGEVSVPQTGGSFYSPIRDEAISLNALIEADPSNPQIPVMAKHVAQQLKQRSWYSTQECVFSLLALGKLARAAGKSTVTAEIQVNGKVVSKFDGKDLSLTSAQMGGNNIQLVTKGQGQLFYYWQSEGISASGQYREEDNYIKVRREFYDRYGRTLNSASFKQNDLIIVKLTLQRSYDTDIDNVVITDMLPAGFEIENPRTKEIPGMDWIKDAAVSPQIDVRDDRINLFVNLRSATQTYYYAVRAVSPGNFVMGPVGAEAMYNGEYHSYHGAGKIVVE